MTKPRVLILGGGISGLSFAHFLEQRAFSGEITLLEKQERLGGWCQSSQEKGFILEKGPRCFKADKVVSLITLLKELGLEEEMIFSSEEAEERFIYYRNSLKKLPRTLGQFLSSPLTRPLLFPLMKDALFPKSFYPKQTVYEFVEKRLGKHAARVLFDPFCLGIFASSSKDLSMEMAFPSLHKNMEKKGSFFSAMKSIQKEKNPKSSYKGLLGFKKGISSLVDSLSSNLKKTDIRPGAEVYDIQVRTSKEVEVFTSRGVFVADHLFVALPKKEAEKLLLPLDLKTFAPLSEIKCSSVACVNVGYDKKVFSKKGFGYLVPSFLKNPNIGTLFESEIFPQKQQNLNHTLFGVMLGGSNFPEIENRNEEELTVLALKSLEQTLQIKDPPNLIKVTKAEQALPQFGINHPSLIQKIEQNLAWNFPQINLLGNYLEGVSVDDCISYSQKKASKFLIKQKMQL